MKPKGDSPDAVAIGDFEYSVQFGRFLKHQVGSSLQ